MHTSASTSNARQRASQWLPCIVMGLTTVACGFEHPHLDPADTGSEGSGSTDVGTNDSFVDSMLDGSTSAIDDGSTSPPDCGAMSFELGVEPPQVVLLLDKSFSMIENEWDHDGDPATPIVTRWNSLHGVVDALAYDVEDGMELGMVLFPSRSVTDNDPETACMVDTEPATMVALHNADAIVDAMPDSLALDLFGGTPTSRGMEVALEHLATVRDGRKQVVVLVTDGAANCMAGTAGEAVFTEYDEGLEPLVASAFAAGIPTHVIGIDIVDAVGTYPADNPYVRLNELALAGGVPLEGDEAFYNTTNEVELLAALGGITDEIGCVFTLSKPAEHPDELTVYVDESEVPRIEECEPGGVGWRLVQDTAPYESIELCEASCGRAHVVGALDVTHACPAVP